MNRARNRGFINILLVVMIVAVLGATGYYAVTKNDKTQPVSQEQELQVEDTQPLPPVATTTTTNTSTEATLKVQPPKQPAAPVKVAAMIDCGSDAACIVTAAKNNCAKAKVVQSIQTEHPFVALAQPGLSRISARSYFEIKGKEGVNCVIYEKFLGGQMTYDQAKLGQLSASDPSIKAEADAVLESYTAANMATAGKDATCKVTAVEFKNKLDDAAEGNFSVNISGSLGGEMTNNDPYAKKCSGPLYQITTAQVKPNNAGTSQCTLTAPPSYNYNTGAITGIQPIELVKGVGMNWDITGYKGTPTQVSLNMKNTAVATANWNGKYFMVQSVGIGSTQLEVTDTAVGPTCKVTIPVTVKELE